MKATSVAPDVALVLVTVKRMMTSSPGLTTGSGAMVVASRNSLVSSGTGETNRSSEAVLPVSIAPPTVAVTAPVVLV